MRSEVGLPTPAPGVKPGRCVTSHEAGNAEELARVLAGHLDGKPVATRGFAEREAALRALSDDELWAALHDWMATLNDVAEAAEAVPADTDVAWTGRTMKVPWFAEHMRQELVLHGLGHHRGRRCGSGAAGTALDDRA